MLTHPTARVVELRTDGHRVHQVAVACPFCGGQHRHTWFDESDGLRSPTCGAPGASYIIRVGAKEKVDHMLAQSPDDALALAPLHLSYCYQHDGGDDIVGIMLRTSIGTFIVYLPFETALQLAGHLVEVIGRRDELREAYTARQVAGGC